MTIVYQETLPESYLLLLTPGPASTAPEDACRRPAGPSEWQGTAADLIKAAYGGDGLPNATFSDTYVPQSWVTAGQTTLYTEDKLWSRQC